MKGNGRKIVIYGLALIICIGCLFPFLWIFVSSIKDIRELYTVPPAWIPKAPTLKNYIKVLYHSNIPQYFINSTIIATGSTLLAMILSVFSAYGFVRFQFRGSRFLQTAILASQMLPTAVIIVPLFIVLRSLNLINTHLGLILAYLILTLPLCVWMIMGYFRSIPLALEEAAAIDGCSRVGVLTRIVLPIAIPGIIATAVYSFITSWNEFIFALSFASDKRIMTLPIGLAEFASDFYVDWGSIMAASFIMTIPIAVFFLALQKLFISGLMSGATKG